MICLRQRLDGDGERARGPARSAVILLVFGFLGGCGDVADGADTQRTGDAPESWQAHLERSDVGLLATQLPGGGRAVDLRGRYQHAQVVSIESGKPSLVCADRVPAVSAVLNRAETDPGQ